MKTYRIISPKPKLAIQSARIILCCLTFFTAKSDKRLSPRSGVTNAGFPGLGPFGTCLSVTGLDPAHFTVQPITNKTVWLVTAGSKIKLATLVTNCPIGRPVYYH